MLIKFNEERLGRPHIYFEGEGYSSGHGPSSGYSTAEGMGPAATTTTGQAAQNAASFNGPSTGGGPAGAQSGSAPAGKQSAVGATPATVAATNPTSATAAQAQAATARASQAAANANARAADGRSAFAAANERGGLGGLHGGANAARGGAESMGADVVNAINLGRTATSATHSAMQAARSFISNHADTAINAALTGLGVALSEKGGASNGKSAAAVAADLGMNATEADAAARTALSAIAGRNSAADALSNVATSEEAATAAVNVTNNVLNENKGVKNSASLRGALMGSAQGAANAIANGKVSPTIAQSFMKTMDAMVAKEGYASYDVYAIPQMSISEFGKLGDAVGSDAEFVTSMANSAINYAVQNQLMAAVDLAAQLDLSVSEVAALVDAINVLNDPEASLEDREAAFANLVDTIMSKLENGNKEAAITFVKMMMNAFASQVDKCQQISNEKDAFAETLKLVKEMVRDGDLTNDIFELFDKEFKELSVEKKAECKFARHIKSVINAVIQRFGLTTDDIKAKIPDHQIALFLAAIARLNCLERSWHLGSFLLKMICSLVMMPMCPIFAIKGLIASIKDFRGNEMLASQLTDANHNLVDYFNDPENRRNAVEIMAESNLYAAGSNLKNKAIKAAVLSLLGLLVGDISLFAIGVIQGIITAARYAIAYGVLEEARAFGDDAAKLIEMISQDNGTGTVLQPMEQMATPIRGLTLGEARYAYANEYEASWQKGGNYNTEDVGGYNAGIGSEEEYANYIAENIARDPVTRRWANELNA